MAISLRPPVGGLLHAWIACQSTTLEGVLDQAALIRAEG
jgi:hypothetical protein